MLSRIKSYLFKMKTGKVMALYEGHSNKIKAVKVYDKFLFTASADSTVRQWNLKVLVYEL